VDKAEGKNRREWWVCRRREHPRLPPWLSGGAYSISGGQVAWKGLL